jgi:PhnB protein
MLADEYPAMGYKSPTALGGSPVLLHLLVDDVDAVWAAAIGAGATAMAAVSDQFDGERRGTVVDPFGHIWLLATRRESVGYGEMAERFTKLTAEGGA